MKIFKVRCQVNGTGIIEGIIAETPTQAVRIAIEKYGADSVPAIIPNWQVDLERVKDLIDKTNI